MPTDRLFCSECGASNEPDAGFCESCGHRLPDAYVEPEDAGDPEASPSPGRKLSPKLVAALAIVVLAGGAWAFRSPITAYIASLGGKSAKPADSVQLAPIPQDIQLNDKPIGNQPPGAVVKTNPSAVAPQRQQQPNVAAMMSKAVTARATRPGAGTVRQPDAPPPNLPTTVAAFPGDFRPPEPAPSFRPPAVTGVSVGNAGAVAAREEPPARAAGRIAAGSAISLRSADQVCTDKTREGAKFRAVVQQDIEGSNGATIPKGSVVTFVVDHLKSASGNQKAEFSVAPESIELAGERYAVEANVEAVSIKEKRRSLLGALVGAATVVTITKAAGGDTKQAVAGGVAGGAAGAIIGSQLKTGDGCIEKNAPIRITLRSDLAMRAM